MNHPKDYASHADRLIAILGGDKEGLARVAGQLVAVARAAEAGRFPDGGAHLPPPFRRAEDLNAWGLGATIILTNYIETLLTLAPLATEAMRSMPLAQAGQVSPSTERPKT